MRATSAHGLRARAAILAVAVVGAAGSAGVAEAGALMPDGERIDAVVRTDRTVPDAGSGPTFEPTTDSSPGLPSAETVAGIAGAAAVAITAAALAGRRRLRPAQ